VRSKQSRVLGEKEIELHSLYCRRLKMKKRKRKEEDRGNI